MDIQLALIVAGLIFGFVSFIHLLRIIYKTSVVIGGKELPLWTSLIGSVISLLLMIWMFLASIQ